MSRASSVEEIRERLAAISPTPWRASTTCMDDFAVFSPKRDGESHVVAIINQDEHLPGDAEDTTRFIAHAPTDLRWLLERMEALEEALEEIRRETDPDRIRITGREPQVDRVWHLAREALEQEPQDD